MALTRRSSATERPVNVKRFRPASACDPLFTPMFIAVFCDETFKSVKKMGPFRRPGNKDVAARSEEHTSELQSLMRISSAVFCLKQKNNNANLKMRHQQDTT